MHGIMQAPAQFGAQGSQASGMLRSEAQVQSGLNLFLRLKTPAQMPALLADIAAQTESVHAALESLHYVHFARFLPSLDGSTMMVITAYDGSLKSYVMDFVAVLGDVFTVMLQYMVDAPRLPVQKYPREFWRYVERNNVQAVQPWTAYPDMTVLDVQSAASGAWAR